jgi:hypothetical protein
VVVVPRFPDQDGITLPPALLGHARALEEVETAGAGRVCVVDVESPVGVPVYVHAKVCVVDATWAAAGSGNFNRRSWTRDSELDAAVLDEARDDREPRDPGGLGDGARVFARDLRVRLWREHLDVEPGSAADPEIIDPTARSSCSEPGRRRYRAGTTPVARGPGPRDDSGRTRSRAPRPGSASCRRCRTGGSSTPTADRRGSSRAAGTEESGVHLVVGGRCRA